MEIVNVEAKTFEEMLSKFEGFATRMEQLCRLYGDRDMSEWLDNQNVCLLLKISPRTLQTLRDNGTLAYSQINHKTYYKPEDVEKIVPLVEDKRKQAKTAMMPEEEYQYHNLLSLWQGGWESVNGNPDVFIFQGTVVTIKCWPTAMTGNVPVAAFPCTI